MGALEHVDVPGYAAILFRRTFTDLELPGAIMDRARTWLAPYTETGEVQWQEQKKRFTFPSGATLQFAYLKHEGDELRYQSAEFQYVGFDELTHFPEAQYTYLFSRLRRPDEAEVLAQLAAYAEQSRTEGALYRELTGKLQLSRVPLRMRAASNPGGPGHGWVKERFPIEWIHGGCPPEQAPKHHRLYVPARIADNPHLDATTYRKGLALLGETLQRQLELGDWDVAAGLAFTVINDVHLVPPVDPPPEWDRFESMDFGVANPTCVLAWAVDYDGNCLIFDSYYQDDTLVSEHAKQIEARRQIWWPEGASPVTHADPSMWARNGRQTRWGEPATDVTEFQEHGVTGLLQANNHRRPGRIRLMELLEPDEHRRFPNWHPLAGRMGAPRLFIVASRCPELVKQLKSAPTNEQPVGAFGAGELVDPKWESAHGHAVAAARYGAMSRPSPSSEPQRPLDDPRAELIRKVLLERDQPPRRAAAYQV